MSTWPQPNLAPLLATLTARLATLALRPALDPHVERERLLRRGLEEWGISCHEATDLTVLEAFGVVSGRGAEVTLAADLGPAERALGYGRALVRLAMRQDAAFHTWFDYRPGLAPAHQPLAERRTAAVVDALARALLAGRLDAAPHSLRAAAAGPADADRATTLLGDCSRKLLGGLHRASTALYWHSGSYQALRATEPMVQLTTRVHRLLSAA